MAIDFIKYDPSVEHQETNEKRSIETLSATFAIQNKAMCDHYRHAVRGAHSKSHGILKGHLTIFDDVPAPYRQGIFANAASYEVIARLSTVPGDILPDSVSTGHGFALKVLGIQSDKMLEGHEAHTTQDFVLASGLVFAAPDLATFARRQVFFTLTADYLVRSKELASLAARTANSTLALIGLKSKLLAQLGRTPKHMLGDEYGSQAPIRYGEYIAKVALRPASERLKKLGKTKHHIHRNFSALQKEVAEFFANERAEYDLCVQLCSDLQKMPIENPSIEWPEKLSPYVPVARLTFEKQECYTPARRVFGDDQLAFSPWHGIEAHRPLGRIMRARKRMYQESADFRAKENVRTIVEPASLADVPD